MALDINSLTDEEIKLLDYRTTKVKGLEDLKGHLAKHKEDAIKAQQAIIDNANQIKTDLTAAGITEVKAANDIIAEAESIKVAITEAKIVAVAPIEEPIEIIK